MWHELWHFWSLSFLCYYPIADDSEVVKVDDTITKLEIVGLLKLKPIMQEYMNWDIAGLPVFWIFLQHL